MAAPDASSSESEFEHFEDIDSDNDPVQRNESDIDVSEVSSIASDDSDLPRYTDRNFEEDPPKWKTDNFQDFVVGPYNGPPEGPNLPAEFDATTALPVDYFKLFFTDDMMESIARNTNRYARFKIHESRILEPGYTDPFWKFDGSNDTTAVEMQAFFGVQIILGINPTKQYTQAFSRNKYMTNPGIREAFSLKRFEKISQYLHVSNRENEPRKPAPTAANYKDYDWLYKV